MNIDFESLNISPREATHFHPPLHIEQADAEKAWVAARLFYSWVDIMNDGPDDSDKMMAQRFLEAAVKLARELK